MSGIGVLDWYGMWYGFNIGLFSIYHPWFCLSKPSVISEIKLREYGSEVIEVNDNGFGVEEKNFEGLSMPFN